MPVYLETERLLLRTFTDDDVPALVELNADPEVMRFLGPPVPNTPEFHRERLRTHFTAHYDQNLGFFAAVERAGDRFLGWFHLRPALGYHYAAEAGYRDGDLDLGYRLRRSAWNQGYATEGARALVRKAFAELGARRVVATALLANRPSTRVMEKAGLRRGETIRLPGIDTPGVWYALAREEYESCRDSDVPGEASRNS